MMSSLLTLYLSTHSACKGQSLLPVPADPAARGPWPVGRIVLNQTITERLLNVEVLYPGRVGSEAGKPNAAPDVRVHLPDDQASKIPDCGLWPNPPPSEPTCCMPKQPYDGVYAELPFDDEHGRYPVIVFIHGTAAFRNYFHQGMASHWASRGFVCVMADYPGINLKDALTALELHPVPKTDQVGDTELILHELERAARGEGESEQLATLLKDRIDLDRLGITGHSAGGYATGELSARHGQVVIPMAGGGTVPREEKKGDARFSSLIIGGALDTIVPGTIQTKGYDASPAPKRHLGVSHAGHESYSDLCWMAPAQGGITGVGRSCGVSGAAIFEVLADQGCTFAKASPSASQMANPEELWALLRYATSAVFEETLHCDVPRMTLALLELPKRVANASLIAAWKEEL